MTKINRESIKNLDRNTLIVGLAVAVIFVVIGNLVFAYAMETLDVKAEELEVTGENILNAPFPEYVIPGFENEWGGILLGVVATLAIFAVTLGIANLLKKKKE
ncbi:MAG: PDGLE domain-containing protein [Candidatus Bathyarchaeota archaeon]|nr:PDGLE domain-containing protein [Candidatus Bathyarchaeota archaeon]